jgi:hypothetical protein
MQMQSSIVELHTYGARKLTEAEILLTRIFEKREETQLAAQIEAQAERKILGSVAASLSYRTVITTVSESKKNVGKESQETESGFGDDGDNSFKAEAKVELSIPSNKTKNSDLQGSKTAIVHKVPKAASSSRQLDSIFGESAPIEESPESIPISSKRPAHSVDEEVNIATGYQEGEDLRNDFALQTSDGPVAARSSVQLKKRQRTVKAEAEDDAEVIVDLDTLDSTALYASGYLSVEEWNPATSASSKHFLLDGFGMVAETGNAIDISAASSRPNNTLVIQVEAPSNAKRWSVNIGPDGAHGRDSQVFLHFNPRYNKHMLYLTD